MVYEDIRLEGHIIDSMVLPRVLDDILDLGGDFRFLSFRVGREKFDYSRALIRVKAAGEVQLEAILSRLQRHGAQAVEQVDAQLAPAPVDGVFPEGFYSTTNLETFVRVHGRWVPVAHPEMDCGIRLIATDETAEANTIETDIAETVPISQVKKGDFLVVGRRGVRVRPMERSREARTFEFMSSSVSSEKPKHLVIGEVAGLMRRMRDTGRKILAVVGPAVVHTGAAPALAGMVRDGWVDVVFGGNAVAVHDIEVCLYGTSLGINLERGLSEEGGHEHHLRAINRVRACGSILQAVEQGVVDRGLFYELVKAGVPYVLAGSIRDDGPLPEVLTDAMEAQRAMREYARQAGMCLMLSTMLHSIAVGNLLPASVRTVCVDINPAVVTKLSDRGSFQTIGIVTDVGLFLGELAQDLAS
ncbi:MAG: TIGR00300 family protein [Actinobacteria bacterium]|nr:TIGR00300 family protein [Actinomycetota bacterium]